MKKIVFLISLFILDWGYVSISQTVPYVLRNENQQIKQLSKSISKGGWVYVKDNLKLSPDELLRKYKKAFGYLDNDKVVLKKINKDSISEVYFYQRFHDNKEVENSEFVIHAKKGKSFLCYGDVSQKFNSEDPFLSEEQAFGIAKKHIYPKGNFPVRFKIDSVFKEYRPKGKLLYTKPISNQNLINDKYLLCYAFKIFSTEPFDVKKIYIDALNGSIINVKSMMNNSLGTVNTWYNDSKSFTTFFVQGFPRGKFRLQDRTRGYIHPKVGATGVINIYFDPYMGSYYAVADWDSRNYAEQYSDTWGPSLESTALWAIENAYTYYKDKFGRNGTDGNNMQIRIYPAAYTISNDIAAGYYGSDYPEDEFGFSLGYDGIYIYNPCPVGDYTVTLDVLGHEFTHGVNHYSNDVGNSSNIESMALSESFGDIFGEMIEAYTLGRDPDWKGAYEASQYSYKDLANPNSPGNPNFKAAASVNDPLWNGNIYAKAGVQNRWFYLLSQNIGYNQAAKITYRSMTGYLTSASDYLAAREGSKNAAKEFYGECSFQYQQVLNAWAAVGVGDSAPNPCIIPLSISINSPSNVLCNQCNLWTSTVTGGIGNYQYSWYIDGILVSNESFLEICFSDWEVQYSSIQLDVQSGIELDSDFTSFYVDCTGSYMSSNVISLSTYPNPATDIVTIEFCKDDNSKELGDIDYHIYMLNSSGRILFSTKSKSNKVNINVEKYLSGTYSIIVTKGKAKGTSQIIIK